jgi:tRNA(Ile)-lysidine synthase
MPELARINSDAGQALARAAAIARDEDALLDELARRELARIGPPDPASSPASLDVRAFRVLPPALARRVARLTILAARGSLEGVSYDHIDAALELAARSTGACPRELPRLGAAATDLPGGLRWRVEAGRLRLEPEPLQAPPFSYELTVPGSVAALEARVRVRARHVRVAEPSSHGRLVHLAQSSVSGVLRVRNRRAGDAYAPAGGPGSRLLKRYFIDWKIPRSQRSRLPVVTAGETILWVAWLGVARQARARANEAALELALEAL